MAMDLQRILAFAIYCCIANKVTIFDCKPKGFLEPLWMAEQSKDLILGLGCCQRIMLINITSNMLDSPDQ